MARTQLRRCCSKEEVQGKSGRLTWRALQGLLLIKRVACTIEGLPVQLGESLVAKVLDSALDLVHERKGRDDARVPIGRLMKRCLSCLERDALRGRRLGLHLSFPL